MNIFKSLITAILLIFTASASASIVTFNFAEEANGNEAGHQPYMVTKSGLTLTARGYYDTAEGIGTATYTEKWAYLDHDNADNAGLGVCHTGLTNASTCTVASDDNVTSYEILYLNFGRDVKVESLYLRDGDHRSFSSDFMLSTTSMSSGYTQYNHEADEALYTSLVSDEFWFKTIAGDLDQSEVFYINKMVVDMPEPGPLALLAFSLIGLLLARSRSVKAV